MERRDTDASAGEGEERRRVKVHAEWQRAGCSGSHEKGKFTRIYFADTINFLPPPFQRRKQEIKKWYLQYCVSQRLKGGGAFPGGGAGSEKPVATPLFDDSVTFVLSRETQMMMLWCN